MLRLNLRLKIVLITIFLILVPLIFANFYLTYQMQDSIKENSMINLEVIADEIGKEIEKLINDQKSNIIVLSNNPVLKNDNATKSEQLVQLKITQNYHQIFDDITLIDTNGNVIVSTTYNYQGEWATSQWFQNALSGNITVSDAHVIPNPFKVIVIFLSPIFNDENETIRVISGQIDLNSIWNILDKIKIGDTGYVFLINSNKKILSHPDKDIIFTKLSDDNPLFGKITNPDGSLKYSNENGIDMICGYSSILDETIYNGGGSWIVIVTQESDEVFASLFSLRLQILYVGLVFLVILIIVSLIFSRSFIKPVHKLEKGMKEIAKDNLDYRVDIKSRDELQYLGDSFNRMVKELEKSKSELKNYSKNLEKEVEKRTKDKEKIERQNIQLKKLDELKTAFLNITSHELRTPMTTIKGYVQMLLKQGLGELNKEQKKSLDVVLRNANRLDRLIEDILDVSRLKSGTMKFIPNKIDIKTVIDETVESLHPYADFKKITIHADVEEHLPQLFIDKERVRQVITNLVNNAIKFSPNGSIVNVKVKKDKKDDVLFEVQDFGRGIPKDKQDKVFDLFYQVDAGMDRKFGGTGLGLAISRGIVGAHGGRIWVESKEGEGSNFKFTVPVEPVEDLEQQFESIDVFSKKSEEKQGGN